MDESPDQCLKNIKNLYDDIMSSDDKKKYEKLTVISKDLAKLSQEKPSRKKSILASLKEQIFRFQMNIKNAYKRTTTDYKSFLWKMKRQSPRESFPNSFSLLQIEQEIKQIAVGQEINFEKSSILSYSIEKLCKAAAQILMKNSFCKNNFKNEIILKLVNQIANEYNISSYHNFTHAFSVLSMFHELQNRLEKLQSRYNSFELFMVYISALAHDMGHQGVNSMYEIKRKSGLAIIYHYESVLENMHISRLFKMFRDNPDIDILHQIKQPVLRQKSKKMITMLILSTDMTKHFSNLEKLNLRLKQGSNFENDFDKELLLETIFHGCDIGNPCMSYKQYMNWAVLLSYQFNSQAEREEREQLEVSPFFKYKNIEAFYKGQIGFINTFVLPLWKSISTIYPKSCFLVDQIISNTNELTKKIEEKQSEKY